jgi:hypothetical protein
MRLMSAMPRTLAFRLLTSRFIGARATAVNLFVGFEAVRRGKTVASKLAY